MRLIQESIPQALKDIGAAALSPNLKPGERSDLAKIAATLGVDLTPSLEGAQLAPWEKASMQETARLLGGYGNIEYAFDAQPGTDGGATMIKGVGRLQLNPEQLVSSQGVVDVAKLRATLAHEARHFHDERTLGLTDQPDPQTWFTNLDQFRWTSENAWRAEDALNKALGLKVSEEPVDQRAEGEVSWVRNWSPQLKDHGSGKGTTPWKF
ncbi:MAG: hypothetical protein J0I28_11785 [Caulobacterales bacterium]|nr:hypothetical protein [Caulobacterales bacterium]